MSDQIAADQSSTTNLNQIADAWSQLSGAYLSGLSAGYADLAARGGDIFTDAAKRTQAIVDVHKSAAEAAASWARSFRDAAVANGEKGIGRVMDKWATKFEDKAVRLADPIKQAAEKLSDLSRELKIANDLASKALPGLERVGREALGPLADSVGVVEGWRDYANTGDTGKLAESSVGILGAELGGMIGGFLVGLLVGTGAAALIPIAVGIGVGALVGSLGGSLYGKDRKDYLVDLIGTKLDPFWKLIQQGINWFRPSDPLILDLDNDGIELTPSNSAVLFDHNADGIKTGSQWAKSDDGILVRDLNGNGLIDSGRELFGDQTQISTVNAAGQTITTLAAHGFAALKALDKDAAGVADGIFNASDVAYASLQIWRDLNQDGISQSNELLGLAESGVTAINLTQTPTQVSQGKSTFTKTVSTTDANGNPVTTTREQTAQNVNFTSNNFYREFTDNPVVSSAAAALPQMQGAGLVRDLREAMSLVDANGQATAQSSALSQQVSNFSSASTAQERQGLLDNLITAWGATSSLAEARVRTPDTGMSYLVGNNGGPGIRFFPVGRGIAEFANSSAALYNKLTALERFNNMPIIERYARRVDSGYYVEPPTRQWRPYFYYSVVIEAPRQWFFDQAYDSLKASVYQSLYLQTAGKELLDQVELIIDDKGLRLGFDAKSAKSTKCQIRQKLRQTRGCRLGVGRSAIKPKMGMIFQKTDGFAENAIKSAPKSRVN